PTEALEASSRELIAQRVVGEREQPQASTQSILEKASTGLNVEGGVDVVTRWRASGWVWRPSAPGQVLAVDAALNGKIFGGTVANHSRPDLIELNKGSGQYGFILGFSNPLESQSVPIFQVTGPEGATIIAGPAKVHLDPGDEKDEPEAPAEKGFIG